MALLAVPRPSLSRVPLAFSLLCWALPIAVAQEEVPRAWKLLFDGQSLESWTQRGGAAKYVVEDGAIVGHCVPNTPNSFLCTEQLYGDFALELEFRVEGDLNSGIQIRSEARKEAKQERVFGYQVEIDPSARAWTAGIYDEGRRGWLHPLEGPAHEAARAAFQAGEWNHVRVTAEGAHLRTWLNGVPCADLLDAETLRGFIALQVHGVGKRTDPLTVRWREIRIQDLGHHEWQSTTAEELAVDAASHQTVRLTMATPKQSVQIVWHGQSLVIDPAAKDALNFAAENQLVLHKRAERIAVQWNGKDVTKRLQSVQLGVLFATIEPAPAQIELRRIERLVHRPKAPVDGESYKPEIQRAPEDVDKLASGFTLGAGLQVSLFAAEPLLANPVALALDEQGAVYVAESFRQETKGVPDNRTHEEWVSDDLQADTVDERGAYYLKHHPDYRTQWREQHERVRKLVDSDRDGTADRTTVFASGFNDLLDGTGAGLLVDGASVWFTCIPYLWQLFDRDGDDVADVYEPVHRGYGVRVALRGHDLHGLTFGPDGRIYFSVGDRGYDVRTREGKHFHDPQSGAVFRCERDGSGLEVVATGLRNPQELAFDAYGDLFTGDNNCDAGDSARLVHVVEGGESGWRMNYQVMRDRGPWMPEGIWQTRHEGQPAFVLPPIAYVGAGPSGLVFEPGTALGAAWSGKLLLCDFRGSASHSGILALSLEREGASFRLAAEEKLMHGVLTTDADFGPDGALYVADWVAGWVGEGRGRIWRVSAMTPDVDADQTAERLRAKMSSPSNEELVTWLEDRDQRVRRRAQFELAERGATRELRQVASDSSRPTLARIHAAWALGQLARRGIIELDVIQPWFAATDPELRTQALRVCGDARYAAAAEATLLLLLDPDPRVAAAAALATRKLGIQGAVPNLIALLRSNANRDLVVRHAASFALSAVANTEELLALREDVDACVRLGAVLALRHQRSENLAAFVSDKDAAVAGEAARSIYDLNLQSVFPALAELHQRNADDPHLRAALRRAIAALEIVGDPSVGALTTIASRTELPATLRAQAIDVLAAWGEVPAFDSVQNRAVAFGAREKQVASAVLAQHLDRWLASGEAHEVRAASARAAQMHALQSSSPALLALVCDEEARASARLAGLETLEALQAPELRRALESAWLARDARLRSAADACLARCEPEEALGLLRTRLETGSTNEKQRAIETLASMKRDDADQLLRPLMDALRTHIADAALILDLCEAAEARGAVEDFQAALEAHKSSRPAADPLAEYLECEVGGDVDAGREVFLHKDAVGCTRCHAVLDVMPRDASVLAGPDLNAVGLRLDRRALLESVVEPNRVLAAGFETVYVESYDGESWRGRVVREDDQHLVLMSSVDGAVREVQIAKDNIDRRVPDISGMPTGIASSLTKRELRDLVAFLASCREERNVPAGGGTTDR